MSISSITVGGVTATILEQATYEGDSNSNVAGIAIASVPTGTTGDVVVTFNTSSLRCSVAVWSLLGFNEPTLYDSVDGSVSSTTMNMSIDTPAKGIVISNVMAGQTASSPSWGTGSTVQDFGSQFQTNGYHGGSHYENTTLGTGFAANFTTSNSGVKSGVAVSIYDASPNRPSSPNNWAGNDNGSIVGNTYSPTSAPQNVVGKIEMPVATVAKTLHFYIDSITGSPSVDFKVGVMNEAATSFYASGTITGVNSTGWKSVALSSDTLGVELPASTTLYLVAQTQVSSSSLDASNYVTISAAEVRSDERAATLYENFTYIPYSSNTSVPNIVLNGAIGNSYVASVGGAVYGTRERGEFVAFSESVTANRIGFKLFKEGTPTWDVNYKVYDSDDLEVDSGFLVNASSVAGTDNVDAPYYYADLSSELTFNAGEQYKFVIYSPTSSGSSSEYIACAGMSTTNSTGYIDIVESTYGGTSAGFAITDNNGSSWNLGTVYADVWFELVLSTDEGSIKVYDGSEFVYKPVKVWNGSAWEQKPLKRWDGSQWL